MATYGVVPNRTEDLARDRSRKGGNTQEVTKGVARPAEIPEANESWHSIARMLWDSMVESGQVDFYQQSDWASAYFLCDQVDFYLTAVKYDGHSVAGERQYRAYRSPEMFKAIQSAMGDLLVTEGARRRVRVELEAPVVPSQSAAVLAIADYRAALEEPGDPA